MQTESTSISQLYFSASGRISRSTYWLKFYIPIMLLSIVSAILDFSFGALSEEYGIGLFGIISGVLVLYPSIVTYIKRAHDRNRSGWFVVLIFVPLINIWPAVELLFLKGTDGPNRYGEDPTS